MCWCKVEEEGRECVQMLWMHVCTYSGDLRPEFKVFRARTRVALRTPRCWETRARESHDIVDLT